jgi:hypothetical protein
LNDDDANPRHDLCEDAHQLNVNDAGEETQNHTADDHKVASLQIVKESRDLALTVELLNHAHHLL